MFSRKTTSLSCTQFPVGDGNWDSNRLPITGIVIHTMDGTVTGTAAVFAQNNLGRSSNYGVGLDGRLYQWVDEDLVSYANGNYTSNQSTITIEHEDGSDYNGVRPDILYTESSKLVADICTFYQIPCDRDHIRKHSEVIDHTAYPGGTSCPDALDIDRIVNEAQTLLTAQNAPQPTPDTLLEIKNSDFLKLLRKSESLDKIGTYLGYAQIDIDSINFSDLVIKRINSLTNPVQVVSNPPSIVPDRPVTPVSPAVEVNQQTKTTLLQFLLNLFTVKKDK